MALLFYARAWDLLEGDEDPVAIENKGWAGLWLGEAFLEQGSPDSSVLFLAYCRDVWTQRLPLQLNKVETLVRRLPEGTRLPDQSHSNATKYSCDDVVVELLNQKAVDNPVVAVTTRGAQPT